MRLQYARIEFVRCDGIINSRNNVCDFFVIKFWMGWLIVQWNNVKVKKMLFFIEGNENFYELLLLWKYLMKPHMIFTRPFQILGDLFKSKKKKNILLFSDHETSSWDPKFFQLSIKKLLFQNMVRIFLKFNDIKTMVLVANP